MARTNLPARQNTGGQTPRISRMSTPSTEPIIYNPLPLACSQCRELQAAYAQQNSSVVSAQINDRHDEIPKLDNKSSTTSPHQNTNDAPPPAPKPAPTFHPFPSLPLEIQTQIWKHAVESSLSTPRILPILVHWTPRHPSATHPRKPPITLSPIPTTPPLLHASSLSRKLTLPHYALAGPGPSPGSRHPTYDSPVDPANTPKKTFYINPELDIPYFTSHRALDAQRHPHSPSRSVVRALRVVVANAPVRMRLKRVALGLDVPGLCRDTFFFGDGRACEDLRGVTEVFGALGEDDYVGFGAVGGGGGGDGERMNGCDGMAGRGEDGDIMRGFLEGPEYQGAMFDGITKVDLNKDLRIQRLRGLVVDDFAVRDCLARRKGFKERSFTFHCFVPGGAGNENEEQTIEQRDVELAIVQNVTY